MNRIMLVAVGNYDSKKLISSLQSMILNPEEETVKVIQGRDMEYITQEGTYTKPPVIGKQSFFMGQIVKKDQSDFPSIVEYKGHDMWVSGILNEQEVLDSSVIRDFVESKEEREKVRKNPNLILNYLAQEKDKTIIDLLIDYRIHGMYSVLNLSPKYPCLTIRTTYDCPSFVGYDYNSGVNYFCNSKEVLDQLKAENVYLHRRYDKVSSYYPYGRGYTGAELYEYEDRKKVLEKIKFTTGKEKAVSDFEKSRLLTVGKDVRDRIIARFNPIYEFQRLASKCIDNHVYTFKSKNK